MNKVIFSVPLLFLSRFLIHNNRHIHYRANKRSHSVCQVRVYFLSQPSWWNLMKPDLKNHLDETNFNAI